MDNGEPNLSSTTRVVVKVEDVNDNAPEFDQKSYNVRVPSNALIDQKMFQVRNVMKFISSVYCCKLTLDLRVRVIKGIPKNFFVLCSILPLLLFAHRILYIYFTVLFSSSSHDTSGAYVAQNINLKIFPIVPFILICCCCWAAAGKKAKKIRLPFTLNTTRISV